MKLLVILPALALLMVHSSLRAETEIEISLTEVPDAVLAAALAAMPGIELTEAEVEMEDGEKTYELEGEFEGEEYEIEVSAAGQVLEIEKD